MTADSAVFSLRAAGNEAIGVPAEAPKACKVLLVFPRFNASTFWSLADTCEIARAKCSGPPLGLLTVAALLPKHWDIRLIDSNATPLTDDDIASVDLVLTGGMLPQAPDALTIIQRCKALGVPCCLGGPDATSRTDWYEENGAELFLLGEAEGVMDAFVAAWECGERSGRYEAPKFTVDVTKTPLPRYDLIDFRNYLMMGVQFSRGCPFNCEFCDIIELYGRVPRAKTNAQMIAELEHLLALGYRGHIDFHDDNLIGNKKALKRFLPDLIAWQKARHYPFRFSTEASVNLADDDELLEMLRQANFFIVFIGIESGDTATLISMQKKQNTRRSLADSVLKVYRAGITVVAGFIVGFDTETDSVTDDMVRLIKETSIPIGIIGLLMALPNTQLWRRLEKEGRLYEDIEQSPEGSGDQCTAGLNFETLRPRRDILLDYKSVLEQVYSPKAFFARLAGVADHLRRPSLDERVGWPLIRKNLAAFCRLLIMVARRPGWRLPFVRFVLSCLRKNPTALEFLMFHVAMYLHVGRFTEFVVRDMERRISEIDDGTRIAPALAKSADWRSDPLSARSPNRIGRLETA